MRLHILEGTYIPRKAFLINSVEMLNRLKDKEIFTRTE